LCALAGLVQAAALAWPGPALMALNLQPGQPSAWLQVASLAGLVLSVVYGRNTAQAVWRGWLFATVWLAGTFWWLFVSMHIYGGLAAWLAVVAVVALAAALALPYAVATGLLHRGAPASRVAQGLLFAALWTLAELVRGHWFTGFPWGAGGYAQVDAMRAWAPWVGVYGMGFLAALLAFALAALFSAAWAVVCTVLLPPVARPSQRRGRRSGAAGAATTAAGILRGTAAAGGLAALLWTLGPGAERWQMLGLQATSDAGPMRVWLLQGNIAQDEKFEPGTGMAQALAWYPAQIAEALQRAQQGGVDAPQLVVAPETAVPLLPQQLNADFWTPMMRALSAQDTRGGVAVMLGLPLGSFSGGYTNSVWGIDPSAAARATQGLLQERLPAGWETRGGTDDGLYRYDKHHLVPFGEFIPPLFRWFTDLMNIPLGDFNRGPLPQPPWSWAGQRIAPNICYEDLFGEELAASFRDGDNAPTVLVNLSNIGWFGDTVAIDQHLHISRLRAMELGRPMLRATNTGATAAIDPEGRVLALLPRLTRDRLEVSVQGRSGLTPYARWASRWGQGPVWALCLVLANAMLLWRLRARRRRSAP
jgi:apolipoprotein N-acyltransferase